MPPLSELQSKHVIVSTRGATHLLYEAGMLPVHSNFSRNSNNFKASASRFSKGLMTRGHFTHVFVDEASGNSLILQRGGAVLELRQCGIAPAERFTYFDQVRAKRAY